MYRALLGKHIGLLGFSVILLVIATLLVQKEKLYITLVKSEVYMHLLSGAIMYASPPWLHNVCTSYLAT